MKPKTILPLLLLVSLTLTACVRQDGPTATPTSTPTVTDTLTATCTPVPYNPPPPTAVPTQSGGENQCPVGQAWFPEMQKCCDAISGCGGN